MKEGHQACFHGRQSVSQMNLILKSSFCKVLFTLMCAVYNIQFQKIGSVAGFSESLHFHTFIWTVGILSQQNIVAGKIFLIDEE